MESTDFEDAIRTAVSLGGDSDTLAAITGGIAEAAYSIPGDILSRAWSFLDAGLISVIRAWVDAGKPLGCDISQAVIPHATHSICDGTDDKELIFSSSAVTIRQVAVSSMDNNVYLITSRVTGRQILIDAANDPEAISAMIASATNDGPAPAVDLIVTTHSHADHLGALAEMVRRTGARTAAGREDSDAITDQTGIWIDQLLDQGDTIGVEGIELAVIGLRGHTPGSVALAHYEPKHPVHLFTGDSLFPGGIGNTNHDPVRFSSLLTDVRTRIFDVYADDTIVHPGHGKPTTLGTERPHLGEWEQRGW